MDRSGEVHEQGFGCWHKQERCLEISDARDSPPLARKKITQKRKLHTASLIDLAEREPRNLLHLAVRSLTFYRQLTKPAPASMEERVNSTRMSSGPLLLDCQLYSIPQIVRRVFNGKQLAGSRRDTLKVCEQGGTIHAG